MLTEIFTQALTYASGSPYITHLLGVASIALEYGANEDEAILQDAIEYQGGAISNYLFKYPIFLRNRVFIV